MSGFPSIKPGTVHIDLSQPVTVILVGRLVTVKGSDYFFTGAGGGVSFNLGTNSDATKWQFSNGSNISFPSDTPPDTNWHIFIAALDGASSVLSLDGAETGDINAGAGPTTAIRVGATSTAYTASQIRRLAILPWKADAGERATTYSRLATYYGM
jgi:hypothetical protein